MITRSSKIANFIWVLAAVPFLFAAENIWIDPRLRHRLQWFPSLVPEALSGAWILVLSLGLLSFVLLIFFQVLLIRSAGTTVRMKLQTAFAVLLVGVMLAQWSWVTTGHSGSFIFRLLRRTHTIALTWTASSSPVAGYNIYRSTVRGADLQRINGALVRGVTYTDTAEGGATYFYVIRAVDAAGHESLDSNEISVTLR